MASFTKATGLALIALGYAALVTPADARSHHHHRFVHRTVHGFVFASPQAADFTRFNGRVGGVFETGILGPTTANPYEHPAVGYRADGSYGPGYAYPAY